MRIGVVGIVLKNDKLVAQKVQATISQHSSIIVGRMGVPDKETNINTISLIVKGENEEISSLAGRLGKIDDVYVKSALVSLEV